MAFLNSLRSISISAGKLPGEMATMRRPIAGTPQTETIVASERITFSGSTPGSSAFVAGRTSRQIVEKGRRRRTDIAVRVARSNEESSASNAETTKIDPLGSTPAAKRITKSSGRQKFFDNQQLDLEFQHFLRIRDKSALVTHYEKRRRLYFHTIKPMMLAHAVWRYWLLEISLRIPQLTSHMEIEELWTYDPERNITRRRFAEMFSTTRDQRKALSAKITDGADVPPIEVQEQDARMWDRREHRFSDARSPYFVGELQALYAAFTDHVLEQIQIVHADFEPKHHLTAIDKHLALEKSAAGRRRSSQLVRMFERYDLNDFVCLLKRFEEWSIKRDHDAD